jgi:putative heme-binding domain-containing protein
VICIPPPLVGRRLISGVVLVGCLVVIVTAAHSGLTATERTFLKLGVWEHSHVPSPLTPLPQGERRTGRVAQNGTDLTAVAQVDHEQPATSREPTTTIERPPRELSPEEKAGLAEGQSLFRGLCSGCHGGLGRGGKGPDLTDNRWLHGETDEDINRVIQNGVPGTTMKKLGESLKEQQIARIIAYIRSLARTPGEGNWKPYMTGDPKAGELLFFDDKNKAPCAKCHTVNRKGGRVGPALDRIAARRSGEFIMESIVQPSKFIDPLFEAVTVATPDGKVIVGLRINETNFSIQLREENGRFHSLLKRDLEDFRVMDKSLMPENIPEQLTVKQLHDLFAFLMTLE